MITNFEEITQELTDQEMQLIPIVTKGFKNHSATNPIKEPDICESVNTYLEKNGYKIRMTGARLRKFVNYIRSNQLLPLIATSNGYFVSFEKEVIERQVKSLEQRCRSMQTSADGLKKFL